MSRQMNNINNFTGTQGFLSPWQKGISSLSWGEIPFCWGEMAETGEKLPDVFILRCKD